MLDFGKIAGRLNIKVDKKRVEQEFIDIVVNESEKLKVDPETLAIIIKPELKKRKKDHSRNEKDYLVKGFVVSMKDEFDVYVQPLKYFTQYDLPFAGKPISTAFLKIWTADAGWHEAETIEHYSMTLKVRKNDEGDFFADMKLNNEEGKYGKLDLDQIIGEFNGKTLSGDDINEMKKDLEKDNLL